LVKLHHDKVYLDAAKIKWVVAGFLLGGKKELENAGPLSAIKQCQAHNTY
jgi:hypothetical protein